MIRYNSSSFTKIPGYYQISGVIDSNEGTLLSNNIPVSACPNDYDNDGVNDNIDVDNDNDGLWIVLNPKEIRI